jgi:hypothetical protein
MKQKHVDLPGLLSSSHPVIRETPLRFCWPIPHCVCVFDLVRDMVGSLKSQSPKRKTFERIDPVLREARKVVAVPSRANNTCE